LAGVDVQGATTEPFLQAGKVRADISSSCSSPTSPTSSSRMFRFHNANVFYELGIRHALQPKRTLLLRARNTKARNERTAEDEVPFDLRTEPYLENDSEKPADKLALLIDALRQTLANEKRDSPVFQMLPDREAQDRSRFLPVPQSFRDDVELAVRSRKIGLLGLLAMASRSQLHIGERSERLRGTFHQFTAVLLSRW
jgi:hypothetical protein